MQEEHAVHAKMDTGTMGDVTVTIDNHGVNLQCHAGGLFYLSHAEFEELLERQQSYKEKYGHAIQDF